MPRDKKTASLAHLQGMVPPETIVVIDLNQQMGGTFSDVLLREIEVRREAVPGGELITYGFEHAP